jgi:hypothetical protein
LADLTNLSQTMKKLFLFLILLGAWASPAQEAAEKVYRTTELDHKPDLEKGMYTLTMFVSDHFKFPDDIKNKKVTVFTSFIIEPDGTMTDKKAFYVSAKDLVPTAAVEIQTEAQKAAAAQALEAMKTEAARVLALFDEKWIPGQLQGKPVRCLYNYPITFAIQ